MRRVLLATVAAALLLAGAAFAKSPRYPAWLETSERQVLARVFGGAQPVAVFHIAYPHKIAVVFEFQRVVICGACSAPSNAQLPRGRVVRVSFERATHRLTGAFRFCEVVGDRPPLSACLAR